MKNKKFLFVLLPILAIVALILTYSDAFEYEGTLGGKMTDKTLLEVIEHFKESDLDLGENIYKKDYNRMGAKDAVGLVLEGEAIEVYVFDLASVDKDLLENLEKAQEEGIFWDSGIEKNINVVMNDNVMLFGLEIFDYVHPQKDKIVEVFNNFGRDDE
jgi:hypothetical protein